MKGTQEREIKDKETKPWQKPRHREDVDYLKKITNRGKIAAFFVVTVPTRSKVNMTFKALFLPKQPGTSSAQFPTTSPG